MPASAVNPNNQNKIRSEIKSCEIIKLGLCPGAGNSLSILDGNGIKTFGAPI
jgi:hypothetical protein